MKQEPKLTVIYNDTCPICSREVDAYQRASARCGADIAYAGLSDGAYKAFGLSEDQAARRFHVVKGGELISGIPAFALLWDDLPRMAWLARIVRLPVLRGLLGAVYDHVLAPILYALHKRRQRSAAQ